MACNGMQWQSISVYSQGKTITPRYKIEHAVGAGHFTRAYLATDLESNTKEPI